jgi:hypothetical protein
MASIQFYGIDSVVDAAHNRKCPKWAIFQGSQFLFKHESEDQAESESFLHQVLDNIQQSTAVYTIKFYEDTVKIKDKTPHDGSFNFRLIGEDERNQKQLIYQNNNRNVLDKLEAIEARIKVMEEEEYEEEPESMQGILAGLLKEPEKLGALINIGKSFFGMRTQQQQPVRVSGTPDTEKLHKALETLKKNDPNIIEHLHKLAEISETNQATFKYLLSMLEKM